MGIILFFLTQLHLVFAGSPGTPECPANEGMELLKKSSYKICYSLEHRQPLWTYHLNYKNDVNGNVGRQDRFIVDIDLDFPVKRYEYAGSGYDRGHLVPARDRQASVIEMLETFLMSNVSPQNPSMNKSSWISIETYIRNLVRKYGRTYVITGPELNGSLKTMKALGRRKLKSRRRIKKYDTGISIPKYFYKLAYIPSIPKMIAFRVPNKKITNYKIEDFVVTVDSVESRVGINFFQRLPKKVQDKLEPSKKIIKLR